MLSSWASSMYPRSTSFWPSWRVLLSTWASRFRGGAGLFRSVFFGGRGGGLFAAPGGAVDLGRGLTRAGRRLRRRLGGAGLDVAGLGAGRLLRVVGDGGHRVCLWFAVL